MAGGGGRGEWSTHIEIYEFKWLHSVLGLDYADVLLRLGLDAYSAHRVIFCISSNSRS